MDALLDWAYNQRDLSKMYRKDQRWFGLHVSNRLSIRTQPAAFTGSKRA